MSSKENHAGPGHLFTPARLGLTLFVLSLLAAFGSSSCNSKDDSSQNRNIAPPVAVNPSKAPVTNRVLPATIKDTELKAVTGTPIKLSDYDGKVLLLNLWATWCGPCRMEIPELVKFHDEYHAKGLEIVGLSTEPAEASAEGVRRFVQEYNMNYRVGWVTPEVAITLMQGNNAIPQSFLISRDGRILKRFIGFNYTATPPQLKQAIEDALKG